MIFKLDQTSSACEAPILYNICSLELNHQFKYCMVPEAEVLQVVTFSNWFISVTDEGENVSVQPVSD